MGVNGSIILDLVLKPNADNSIVSIFALLAILYTAALAVNLLSEVIPNVQAGYRKIEVILLNKSGNAWHYFEF